MINYRVIDKGLKCLLERAPAPEIDYNFVIDCLQTYKAPRVKLNHLLKTGALIRVKKGIYIFNKNFAKQPYCHEVLANLIYGPSYVSLEWACQHHRIIPEMVRTVTSVTTNRSKSFNTPFGLYSYEHQPITLYPVGVTLVTFSPNQQALVATKEKALSDLLMLRRGQCRSQKQMEQQLFEDLRVEEDDLMNFSIDALKSIYTAHPHSAIMHLIQVVQKIQK